MSAPYNFDPEDASITVAGNDGTPTRADVSNLMFTRASGPPVATPPQMENGRQNFNMGGVPDPSKSDCTPTRRDNQPQMMDFGSTPTRRDNQHPMMSSHSTPTRWDNQYQMMSSGCTPTHQYNQSQTMSFDSTPTRRDNQHSMMSSGSTPTRRDNQHQMMGAGLTPTRHYIPPLNSTYLYDQRQMAVDPFPLLNSGLPATSHTRQDSACQTLPTGLLPSPSFFGAGTHTSPPNADTPVAPARTWQGIPHRGPQPSLVIRHEGPAQDSFRAPAAVSAQGETVPPKPSAVPSNMAKLNTQECSAAPVVTPTPQMTAPPKPNFDPSGMPKLRVQEGFGGPIAVTTRQENTTPKSSKVQQARNVSAPAKPESATPKAPKAKSQEPGAADSNNQKPDAMVPKSHKSDIADPKAQKPVAAGPKTQKPVVAGPRTQMPIAANPQARMPFAAGPRTQIPIAPNPKAQKLVAAEPQPQKPGGTDPKTQKSDTPKAKAQEPDVAAFTTPKRRASAAHAQTPRGKMPKTAASMQSQVQDSTLNVGATSLSETTTPVRNGTASGQFSTLVRNASAPGQPSTPFRDTTASGQALAPSRLSNLSLGQLSASSSTPVQQSIARYVVAAPSPTPAATSARIQQRTAIEQDLERTRKAQDGAALSELTGTANNPLDQSSQAQASVSQNSGDREGIAQPSPNGNAGSTSAQSSRAQDSALQQPNNRQVAVPAVPQAQSNHYPSFPDGDVLIISSTGKAWKLHSTILVNASSSLKSILAKQGPVKLTKREREEGMTLRWKLVMDKEPNADGADPEGLKFKSFKPVAVYGRASHSSFSISGNFNGMAEEPQFDNIYDNFFKCVYSINPAFSDTPDDPQSLKYINDAYLLVEAAKYLNALPAVRLAVEAHLLRLNQVLWDHICEQPESWIHLAAQIQSPLIFREAMVHIVGRFDLRGGVEEDILMDDKHGELGHQIWDLIQRKAMELKDKKLRIERTLIEYYPDHMCHHAGQVTVPGRAVYSEDIYFWQSLTLFRQFCASAYLSNTHHRGHDRGISFYRKIASGNYLKPPCLAKFFSQFSMSTKGKERLYGVLEIVKDDMKHIVEELVVDRSQGSRGKELGHLTCTEVLEEELPWYVEMNGAL